MVPMVDVMTFLIAFFLMFTTLKMSPTGFELRLPRASTAAAHETSHAIVSLDREGNLYFNNRRVTWGSLEKDLVEHLKKEPDSLVIIRADRDVRYSLLVDAMDIAREAGAKRLALAAEVKKKP